LRGALDALDVGEFDFVGTWGGALVGLELALMEPKRLRRLVLCDLLYFPPPLQAQLRANYTPDIQPDWYGGYLLQAWHLMRDQGLFWPWYRRKRAGIIWKPPFLDSEMVQRRVLELFRSNGMWRQAYQAHFSYPTAAKLRQLRVPALLAAPPWDPQLEVTQQAARDFPQFAFRRMPSDMNQWGAELLPFLNA
jgi:pimeloyl-ACP methyl ester carboxylesterase